MMLCVKMMKYILCTALLVSVAVCAEIKGYREDYKYNNKTDAFYKLHPVLINYNTAKEVCETERAKLMRILPKDVTQAQMMMKESPDIKRRLIWVRGLHYESEEDQTEDTDALYRYAYDRYSLIEYYRAGIYFLIPRNCKVLSLQGKVFKTYCNSGLPFICKVDVKDIYVDPQCNVFSRGYQYIESVGSCYKISSSAVSWNWAFAECQDDGAHLLILNSDLERQAVHNLTRSEPKLSNKEFGPWYYVGIIADDTEKGSPFVFKTIFGQTLEEAGYAEWYPGEPNNLRGKETCGSISRSDGKYNDMFCNYPLAFICEKEVIGKTND